MNNLPPAIRKIAALLNMRPAQARAIMPGDDNSTLGFPGALVTPDDDSETWGEREHKRDIEEFQRGYRNNG
jgi:hypothetical protein